MSDQRACPSVDAFHFERTFALSEERFAAIWSGLPLRSLRVLAFLALFLALAVACLFWRYTIALGIGLLLFWIFMFLCTWMAGLPMGMAHRFKGHPAETATYGASEEEFWRLSATVDCTIKWRRLRIWRETAGMLVLQARGIPPVYLPLEGLRREGVYEAVLELAKRHGKPAQVLFDPAPPEWEPHRRRRVRRHDIEGRDRPNDL